MKNTKQQLLSAYNRLLKKIEEERDKELKPEKKLQEKKKEEVLSSVAGLSTDDVTQGINSLKVGIGKSLSQVSDKLEAEVKKLDSVQQAIEIKQQELKEIYEIERSAASLAALIEAQHQERQKFSDDMASQKESLREDIERTRTQWKTEKEKYEAGVKEQKAIEANARIREREEYKYAFDREKQLARDKFDDEKASLLAEKEKTERDIKAYKAQSERELQEREKLISEREIEFETLQVQVQGFPAELERAAEEASKEATEKIQTKADYEKNLLEKQFEGERNVLTARIESLEQTVKEQHEQLVKLSKQQELAYQKVQDVAVKAIEGASKYSSYSSLKQILTEQGKKQSGDG
jgi:hypothetical protein